MTDILPEDIQEIVDDLEKDINDLDDLRKKIADRIILAKNTTLVKSAKVAKKYAGELDERFRSLAQKIYKETMEIFEGKKNDKAKTP